MVENGGLYFVAAEGERLVKVYAQPAAERRTNRRALERHVDRALAARQGRQAVGGLRATEVDLAIDYAEDAALGAGAAHRLEGLLTARGVRRCAAASTSIAGWAASTRPRRSTRFLEREWGTTLGEDDAAVSSTWVTHSTTRRCSRAFGLSVGVANVMDVLDQLDEPPAFVTRAREGEGLRRARQGSRAGASEEAP